MAKFFYVLGVLIMLLSGGCSLVFGMETGQYWDLTAVALIGGIPFAVGFLIFFLARRSIKSKAQNPSE